MQILAFFVLFVHPQSGEHLLNLERHQARENGVACVLRGRRQNRGAELVLRHRKQLRQQRLDALPLVVAEIVYHYQKHLLAFVQRGKNGLLEHVGTKYCVADDAAVLQPTQVAPLHELGKRRIGLLALHVQHLLHSRIGFAQTNLPLRQRALHSLPFLQGLRGVYHVRDVRKLLPVARLRLLRHDALLVHVFLQAKQYLRGIDRLDEVVGYLLSDGLFHHALLLRFGDHHHRQRRMFVFDDLQGLQAAQTRHLLVQKHDVQRLVVGNIYCVLAVVRGQHFVAFLVQIDNIRLQQVNLVISPKNSVHIFSIFLSRPANLVPKRNRRTSPCPFADERSPRSWHAAPDADTGQNSSG